jgi:hypothetical protein
MGVFFELAALPKHRIRDLLTSGLLETPPASFSAAQRMADDKVSELGIGPAGIARANPWSFVVSFGFLALFAAGALWAEAAQWKVATENLWKGFGTILGVVLGFVGGEAAGIAGKGQ